MKEAPLRLKDLISKLEKVDASLDLFLDHDDRKPTHLISWRGVYAELSIDSDIDGKPLKVEEFLTQCRNAVGKTFEGYKGGDFVMSEDSLVYADEYSTSSGVATCDISVRDGKAVIETVMVNHW